MHLLVLGAFWQRKKDTMKVSVNKLVLMHLLALGAF